MQIVAAAPAEGDLDAWADATFAAERAAGRRLPGIGHRWHYDGPAGGAPARARGGICRPASPGRRARPGRSGRLATSGTLSRSTSTARWQSLSSPYGSTPDYGDLLFAIARSFGLAAHIVEEREREVPMRMIDPTAALYDGDPVPQPAEDVQAMRVRVISPFDDAEQIWLGLDHPGQRRKVFRFVSPEIGSEEFMAGITIFEPGESSSYHVHAESEEINLVLAGSGVVVSEGEEASVVSGRRHVGPQGRPPPAPQHRPGAAQAALGLHPTGAAADDVGRSVRRCSRAVIDHLSVDESTSRSGDR